MKKASALKDYLDRYAAGEPWSLQAGNLDHLEQVVVIPAYAEKDHLFDTLLSLAQNDEQCLQKTLVVCVINNKSTAPAADKENNARTLECIQALIGRKSINGFSDDDHLQITLQKIAASPIRLACVDAASPGMEIPEKEGGVGMARKIGMDTALRVLGTSNEGVRLIFCLDADTLVQANYLSAVRKAFAGGKTKTGILAYEHPIPPDGMERTAIVQYEIFLRYWVLGLCYADSPYAFHSIGSTMVITTGAYLGVRGMNRRAAGEDFYFLNKLAKTGSIRPISETVVYPSARVSGRVPFGTGAAVQKIAADENSAYPFYDPRVFQILKEWIALMRQSFSLNEHQIMDMASRIDSGLISFLDRRDFLSVWPKIRANVKDEKTCQSQFHRWFDGFETLKLVNDLTRECYPRTSQREALMKILPMMKLEIPGSLLCKNNPDQEDQLNVLACLRRWT